MLKNNATEKTFYATNSSFLRLADANESSSPKIEVVNSLPANPDADTFYFVTGS